MVEHFDDLVNASEQEQQQYTAPKEKKQTVSDRAKQYAQQKFAQWQQQKAQRDSIKNQAHEQYVRDRKQAQEDSYRARLKDNYSAQIKNARDREYKGPVNYYSGRISNSLNAISSLPIARKSSQDVLGMSLGGKTMFNSFTSGQNIAGLTGFGGMSMSGGQQRSRPAIRTETVQINGKSYTRRIKPKSRPVNRQNVSGIGNFVKMNPGKNKFRMW